jgi:hypothetical protein
MPVSYYLAVHTLLQSPVSEIVAHGLPHKTFVCVDGVIELSQGASLLVGRPVDAQGQETGEPLIQIPLDKIDQLRAVSTQALRRGYVTQSVSSTARWIARQPFLTDTELKRLALEQQPHKTAP